MCCLSALHMQTCESCMASHAMHVQICSQVRLHTTLHALCEQSFTDVCAVLILPVPCR
jgi:hypothetical protein